MRNPISVIIIAVSLIPITLAAYLLNNAFAQGTSQSPKIGVVNIAEAFQQFKERVNRENSLKAYGEKLTRQIDKERTKAIKMKEELDALEAGTSKYLAKFKELVQITSNAQVLAEQGEAYLKKQELSDRQDLYTLIREAISDYAKKNGYDLILKIDDMRISGANPITQDIQMSSRSVLHNSQGMDITQAVIDKLNKK